MNRPVEASYLLAGISREEVFAALLEVERFPEWAVGLEQADVLGDSPTLQPGVALRFVLSAAGLTHEVMSKVTAVERPQRIAWQYTSGASGNGGWILEEAGRNAVTMALRTDYRVQPAWLNRLAHRPFFRRITGDLLKRSLRRLEARLRAG